MDVNGDTNISGKLVIGGDLLVTGNTVTISVATLEVDDNLIYLNANSINTNPDLGFAGNYNNGTYAHAGFFRDATDGIFKPFDGYTPEPNGPEIDTGHPSFNIAPIEVDSVYIDGYGLVINSSGQWVGENSGLVGYTGSFGFTGSQGDTGFVGSAGFTGSQGDTGFTGSAGFVGSAGFTGSKGDIGFTGSAGANGSTGFTGSSGFTGSKGDTGFTGSSGSAGTNGFTGSSGFTGSIGFTGSKGDTGFTGSIGFVGSVGFSGSQGFSGSVGFTGSQGVGFTGSSGTGFTGSQGIQGFTGSAGTGGGSGLTWIRKTSNYTAAINEAIIADTSGGSFTITLPATPSQGAYVVISDGNDWSVNNLTVARNGSTIESLSFDFILDVKDTKVDMVYDGTTWQVYANVGTRGYSGSNAAADLILATNDTTSNTLYPVMVGAVDSNQTAKVTTPKLYFDAISGTLSVTQLNSLSDINLKRNVKQISDALSIINSIDGIEFCWNDTGKKSYGVIAQQIEKLIPDLVNENNYKSVNYSGIIAFLIEAIKQLSDKIDGKTK